MLRRLGIRAKVLAVLAVPMLVVLLAGAFISYEALQDLRNERTAREIVRLVDASVAVSDALNDERAVSQAEGASADDIQAARSTSDAALAVLNQRWTAEATGLDTFSSAVATQIEAVERGLSEDLPQLRADVDAGQFRVVDRGYASLIDTQLTLMDSLAQELPNREVATYIAGHAEVARTSDSLAQERVDGESLITASDPSAAAGQAYTTLASQTEVYRSTARTAISALAIPGVLLPSGDPSAAFTRTRALIGSGSADAMSVVELQQFLDDIAQQRASLTRVSHSTLAAADSVASGAIATAQQRTTVTIFITAMAALISLLLALIVARAIVIPLRRLTAAATDLREELPNLVEQVQVPGEGPQLSVPQIPVTSRDEVGRLAAAFNSVNSTTIQVAQEQAALRGSIAEMFVNVARRDQVLLNRQLSFIDSLERTEEDPQALANLFRLDHLATRMRRNAESLLVLAGIDSGRRLRDALPLSDVVRTASSEIEQYDRVHLDLQADPHMLGFNALPAAHLLAELLENATVFSEPETPVTVSTGVAGALVEVRILDQGLGMSDAELAAANEKIAFTSASDALGAQRLGLFVVGRLAQRLGTEVVLRRNPHGPTGTETIVRFPAALFQSTEASPLGVYGETSARAEQPPVVSEVDLGSLTDGVTDRGLPRRRSDASGLPTRTSATQSEDRIVLPEVTAPASLSPDLASPDWAPVVTADGASGLPARTPSAGPEVGLPTTPARPAADPAARAGMFAGFRGRGALPTTPAEESAPAAPESPAFVVPGLMPDDSGDSPAEAPAAWSGQPVADADGVAPWTPPVQEEPAAVAPLPVADEPPVEAAAAPVVERWSPPTVDVAQWAAPAQEAPTFEPADAFAGLTTWTSPASADDEPAPYAPFERSLDEARAWATGAIPVVPEPAAAAEPQPMAVPGLEPDESDESEASATDASEQWSQDASFEVPPLEPEPWAPESEPAAAEPAAESEPAAEPEPAGAQQPAPGAQWNGAAQNGAAAQAPVAPAEEWVEPVTPAWAPVANGASHAFGEAPPPFGDVVRAEPAPAKRRGWFGRRKHDEVDEHPAAPAVVPEPTVPVGSAGWAPAAGTPEPTAEPFPVRRSALTPPPAPVAAPAPLAPEPAAAPVWAAQSSWNPPAGSTPFEAPARPPAAGWSPPEWAPHAPEPAAAAEVVAPAPTPEPSVAPRIGTLDDEVAAMLALRSDIQEQALSELSQLSSYRPQVVQASDRLTRRVPTAVPEAPKIVESENTERDPDELRSRLASFQSGTARGRREAGQDRETP